MTSPAYCSEFPYAELETPEMPVISLFNRNVAEMGFGLKDNKIAF